MAIYSVGQWYGPLGGIETVTTPTLEFGATKAEQGTNYLIPTLQSKM